jgi:2-polyprenyl-6-hydroxyphenyl methylase/3-demethylubiquinone-9 3-methyltransferase
MLVTRYYADYLSAERLKRCYDIAPARVKQYLEAEIEYALNFISPTHRVLELGCGYGRVLDRLLSNAKCIVGIDVSYESLCYARQTINKPGLHLAMMDAATLAFAPSQFDVVVCIQNGISAFKVDTHSLVRESMRVTRKGGVCLFSTYSEKFWDNRLEWFRLQSEEGLIGEIDWNQTREGVIRCKDGFKATTFSKDSLLKLTESLGLTADIRELDGSSLFWEIHVT